MANLVGIVKQISGEVVAKDEKGSERKLHLGDEIILGDNILVPDAKSKIVITMTDGQEVMLVGEDTLAFDQNFLNSQGISNVFANNGDLSALQKAILEGKDLNDLEATAAGGGTTASSEGASLNSDSFTKSGHISNVSEGYGNLSDNNTDSRSFARGFAGGSAVASTKEESLNSSKSDESTKPNQSEPIAHEKDITPFPKEPEASEPNTPSNPSEPSVPNSPEIKEPSPKEPENNNPSAPNEPAPNNPNEPINPPAQEISKPAVEFVKDSNNDAMLNAKEATGNTTEVKFTVPSDAVIGHTLVITVAQPGKEKYTEEIEITQELKANGIVKTVEVSEGKLTQASAVIRDKDGNLSEPGADEVTVDTVSPIATPKVEFIKDINDNGVLDKTENSADTTEVKFTVPDDAEIGDFLVITIAEPGKDKFTQEFEITQDLKTNGIVKSVTVKEGEDTQASAIIRDKAGNISPSGFDHVTLEKTTPPGTTDDDGKVVVTVEAGEVKKVTTDDSSKFADQMGLNAKFYLVVNGEESITHNGWENYGTEFNSVEEANSYADQKPHDAEYKVKKIDFKTELGEGKDLVQNTDSLDSSNLKTFLGDNAIDLKLVDGGEFVNKPDTQAVRAMSKISGFVYLEGGKQYKFKAASDDGLEVVINNKKLFENHESLGKNHKVESAVDDTFTPVEKSGFYKIGITHYDIGYGQALLQIYTVENGKDVALGDHENGGIALFNNTDGIRYENGKFVKDFYEVPLSGELHEQDTNNPTIKPNAEVILSKVTQDGSKAEIGKSVVGEDGTYSFNYESADKPKEGDTFVVDYRDEKGKIVATDMDSVDADDIKNISSNEVQGASSEDSGVANGEQADANEPTQSNPSNPLSKSDDSLNFENVSNGKINSDKEPKADDKSAEIKPVNLSANDILDASKGSEAILKDGKEDKVDGSAPSNSAGELNSDTTNDVTPSTFKIDMDNEINNVI